MAQHAAGINCTCYGNSRSLCFKEPASPDACILPCACRCLHSPFPPLSPLGVSVPWDGVGTITHHFCLMVLVSLWGGGDVLLGAYGERLQWGWLGRC